MKSDNKSEGITVPPHIDIEALAEAVANRVVAKLMGTTETKDNGLRPYDQFKYFTAIREARNGNARPLQDYLRHYRPKPL